MRKLKRANQLIGDDNPEAKAMIAKVLEAPYDTNNS